MFLLTGVEVPMSKLNEMQSLIIHLAKEGIAAAALRREVMRR